MARLLLMEYDPTWSERFQPLRVLLWSVIGEDAIRIDHAGSTAVPGLTSKDVIDIQVTVASLPVWRATGALIAASIGTAA